MVLVLLFALVKRFTISRIWDFFGRLLLVSLSTDVTYSQLISGCLFRPLLKILFEVRTLHCSLSCSYVLKNF